VKKILVTGGAGFIGSHLADAYLARGAQVWVVDNLASGKRANVPAGATFVQVSIEDPELHSLFREVGFDLVSHHAAQGDVRVSVRDPQRDARTNVLGLLNVLEAARDCGTRRVIYASSGGVVYGEAETVPTPEVAEKLPESPYGVSKLAGEHYLQYYHRLHGLEYVALRYGNVYGPRQDPHGEAGLVAIWSQRLLDGQDLVVYGDGEQTRDYVFVADVVRANLRFSQGDVPIGEGIDQFAFNVGTGVGSSVNHLADILESVSGLAPGRRHEPARSGELRHSALDVARLRSLGWNADVGLQEGLGVTYQWIADHPSTSNGGPR
jgi:UDP-glucose 4-epimerase